VKAPIAMPSAGIGTQLFELQRVDYMAPEGGGRINGVQAGFPLWSGVWTITNATGDRADSLRAFMTQLRGATRRFLGRDLLRRYPKAYPDGFAGMTKAGGGSFTGAATTWSENIDSDEDSQVSLTNLPAGFVLGVGDYIGFSWTATEASVAGLTWRAMVRVVVGGTANGSGNVTVTCEPPIPAAVPDTATAYLNEPSCVMALITEQSSLNSLDPAAIMRAGGQIVGIQDIRA
jgi:hypothetical protein